MADHSTIDHTGITGAGVPQALDTTDSPQFAGVNLGHASDTTLTRVSAGVVAVEGTNLVKAGAATSSGITMATDRLLGRTTASSGAIEEITVGSGLSLSAGSLTATGGSGVSYFTRRLMTIPTGAASTLDVNSTTYIAAYPLTFYHDWDFFPATHFWITVAGASSAAAQTITLQLAPFASPTNPVSAAGDDLVITNTLGLFSSGWIAVSDAMAGIDELCVAIKGSASTTDLAQRFVDIAFKID